MPVPVILVGAQRSSDRPSSDAATNLIGAVKAAGEAPFAEVGLAMHETVSDTAIVVHRGTKVRKCHTSRRDTFKSINGFPIAKVKNLQVTMQTDQYQRRDPKKKLVLKPNFSEKVALVKFYPGLDPAIIDFYVEKGMKGILLEGSGLGHVSKFCFEAIKNATAKGVVVALASQCIWGRVDMNVYDTGRDLLSFGVVPLEDMFPETALVKLMWALGQTDNPKEAIELLKTNIAGEFSHERFHKTKSLKEDNSNDHRLRQSRLKSRLRNPPTTQRQQQTLLQLPTGTLQRRTRNNIPTQTKTNTKRTGAS